MPGVSAALSGSSCSRWRTAVSSNVSGDADVSPLIEHLPIGDAAIWADKLLNASPRRDVTEYIVRAGFDARTSAEKMTELYLRLAGEK